MFKLEESPLKDLLIIKTVPIRDNRGYFMETYNNLSFTGLELNANFVQENQSMSYKGVIRGLHFQKNFPQGKLIRVIAGKIFDVAVDLRENSSTYKRWYGTILSKENSKQIYIPEGFAHGFLVMSNEAEIIYKCTQYYHPEDQGGIFWDDPDIDIKWPIDNKDEIILSQRDKSWELLKEQNIKL